MNLETSKCKSPTYGWKDYTYCRIPQPYTVGVCRCLPGWVVWKWECYPRAWLGQSCITSAQCVSKVISHHGDITVVVREWLQGNPSAICNPINRKCSCERGFTPTLSRDTWNGLTCTQVTNQVGWVMRARYRPVIFISASLTWFLPSSASTQLNSTQSQLEAEVSLISIWSTHPPGHLPGTEDFTQRTVHFKDYKDIHI